MIDNHGPPEKLNFAGEIVYDEASWRFNNVVAKPDKSLRKALMKYKSLASSIDSKSPVYNLSKIPSGKASKLFHMLGSGGHGAIGFTELVCEKSYLV